VTDHYTVEKLLKIVRERREVVREALTEGFISDCAAFRHLRGKFEVWNELEEIVRSLHKQEDLDD